MKLFVDDIRVAPAGWTGVSTINDAIKTIAFFEPQEISLDHDIEGNKETFMAVAHFIGQKAAAEALWADDLSITIHSDNPVAAKEMEQLLNDYSVFEVEIKPYLV